MKQSVRDSACTSCIHANVCKYKDDYLKLISILNASYEQADVVAGKFRFNDPTCTCWKSDR